MVVVVFLVLVERLGRSRPVPDRLAELACGLDIGEEENENQGGAPRPWP